MRYQREAGEETPEGNRVTAEMDQTLRGGDNGVMVSISEVTEGSGVYQVPRGC